MAPDISKIDTDRHPDPGTPAWNFRDKVIRRLLHGKQSLPSGGPAHPIYQYESNSTTARDLSALDSRFYRSCRTPEYREPALALYTRGRKIKVPCEEGQPVSARLAKR